MIGASAVCRSSVVAAIYVATATAVAYVLAAGAASAGAAATASLVAAVVIGIFLRSTWTPILPFVPLAAISAGVLVSGGRTAGWNDLWFFDLLILAMLGAILVLLARSGRGLRRRLRSRGGPWDGSARS